MFLLAVATLSHKVLWNSPWPSYCNQSVVDPQPDFSKFGVTTSAAPPADLVIACAARGVQEAYGVSVVF